MENVNLQIFQPQGSTELSYGVLLLGYRLLTTATGSCLPLHRWLLMTVTSDCYWLELFVAATATDYCYCLNL